MSTHKESCVQNLNLEGRAKKTWEDPKGVMQGFLRKDMITALSW